MRKSVYVSSRSHVEFTYTHIHSYIDIYISILIYKNFQKLFYYFSYYYCYFDDFQGGSNLNRKVDEIFERNRRFSGFFLWIYVSVIIILCSSLQIKNLFACRFFTYINVHIHFISYLFLQLSCFLILLNENSDLIIDSSQKYTASKTK